VNAVLEDVQNHPDDREVDIDRVGVCDVRIPIVVYDRAKERQQTIAMVDLSVFLPRRYKGTHMSRFLEVLNDHRGEVTIETVPKILEDLRTRLDAPSARLHVRFPYFVERLAPVTKASSLLDVECWFTGEANDDGVDFVLGVRTPITSLCPCSKEISDYGAHNQRGFITIEARTKPDENGQAQMIWIEELIEVAERAASSPVYALLKRPDERHVTMQAFENPAFVEDLVRDVATELNHEPRLAWYRVHALNQESIHNHNAFAEIEKAL